MASSSAVWCDLGEDLLMRITGRVGEDTGLNSLDIIHLRSVCRSWRRYVPVVPKSKLFLPHSFSLPSIKLPTTLVQNTVWSLQLSSDSCASLAQVREIGEGKKILCDPFIQVHESHQICNRSYPKVLSLLNLRVKELANFYTGETGFGKALILPTSVWSQQHEPVLLIRSSTKDVFLWKSEHGKWTTIEGLGGILISDIAIFQGRFVAINIKGSVFQIDLATATASEFGPSINDVDIDRRRPQRRFVVSGEDDLYVVANWMRFDYLQLNMIPNFKAYKLVLQREAWVEVKDFKGQTLIWGTHCSFFIKPSECRGCRPDCIYYSNFEFDLKHGTPSKDPAISCCQIFWPPKKEFYHVPGIWEIKKKTVPSTWQSGQGCVCVPPAPSDGVLKFNIATNGGGFGGLLKEADGRMKAMFFGRLEDVGEINSEEEDLLLTIQYAMRVFIKTGWAGKKKLQIESSSWLVKSSLGILSAYTCLLDLETKIGQVIDYNYVEEQKNTAALHLAQKGIHRPFTFQLYK